MTEIKNIVCLANSRKFNAHCLAGKELTETGTLKKWIRPVVSQKIRELSSNQISLRDGSKLSPLDVFRVTIKKHVPFNYQTENHVVDLRKNWESVGKIDFSDLDKYCDKVNKLWVDGFSSANGLNDRIPIDKAMKLKSSLLLIKVNNPTIHREYEFPSRKWRVRADFKLNNIRYRLSITDPLIEEQFYMKEKGDYPIKNKLVYLTVSLGEEYEGFCYKLVAAVLTKPTK